MLAIVALKSRIALMRLRKNSGMRYSFRFLAVAAVALLSSAVLVPCARADIFEVEGATSCPGSLGGGLCNGSSPWKLSALLTMLEAPNSIGSGTQKYVVTDDIGSSFSFMLTSTGQNNTGVANNAQCQINGGAMSLVTGCEIVDKLGQTTDLGGSQINSLTFPVTVSFSGTALGDTFDLGFVSMQGNTSVTSTVPEPMSLALLATVAIAILVRQRAPDVGSGQ